MNIRKLLRGGVELPQRIKNSIRFRVEHVNCGSGTKVLGKIHVVNRGNISIGNSCKLFGKNSYNPIGFGDGINLIVEKDAVIRIGNSCGISNSTLYAKNSIIIGDRTNLGGGVKIYDSDFHSLDAHYRGTPEDRFHTKSSPVIIGNDVFIGAGVMILKGVHIGDRAIVGAGAVVTHNISEDEIWGGNPAKRIR